MVTFELILSLLVLGAALASLARRLSVPYPVLLAALGLALAFVPGLPNLALDPDLALTLFVAPVLLDAAYDASLRDLRENWRPVAGLTLMAVAVTVTTVAIVIHWLVPGMPWPVAIALGAIVAPPDASAATAVLRQLRPPHRVLVILEGESLFNDASALLIYRAAVGIAGATAFGSQIPGLAAAAVGSAAVGLGLGWLYMRLFARIQEIATAILTQFLGVFLVWILAEKVGLSGIITVVCYALIIARIAPARTPARLRLPSYAVWEVVVFVLNILVFILVGLQLKPLLHRLRQEEGNAYLIAGGTVCITVIMVRIAWVMSYNSLVRLKNHHFGAHVPRPMMLPSAASGLIISWCGMRGIVTLAAALALPDGYGGTPPFPYRDLLLFCAFCVVIGTLVIQGLTLRPLMRALGLRDDGEVDREVRRARTAAAEAAIQTINNEPHSDERAVVKREYEHRLEKIGDQQRTGQAGEPEASELIRLQRSAISAERRVVADLRARNEIGDDAFHQLEEELDRAEVHLGEGGF